MTTTDQLLAVARSQLGVVETGGTTGHNGNLVRYWLDIDPADQGQSWCAAFVSWTWKTAGHPLPPIDIPLGYVNCQDALQWAKTHDLWDESGRYQPGDTVLFRWAPTGDAEHTGLVVADDGTTITTIEGNTSPDSRGSQTNGGGVYLRHRPHGPTVLGVLASSRWLTSTPAPVGPPPAPIPAPAPPPAPPTPALEDDDMANLVRATGDTRWFIASAAGTKLYVPTKAVADQAAYNGLRSDKGQPFEVGADYVAALADITPGGAPKPAKVTKAKAAK